MFNFVIYRQSDGEILRSCGCTHEESFAAVECGDGEAVIEGDGGSFTHYVSGGDLVAYSDEQRAAKQRGVGGFGGYLVEHIILLERHADHQSA